MFYYQSTRVVNHCTNKLETDLNIKAKTSQSLCARVRFQRINKCCSLTPFRGSHSEGLRLQISSNRVTTTAFFLVPKKSKHLNTGLNLMYYLKSTILTLCTDSQAKWDRCVLRVDTNSLDLAAIGGFLQVLVQFDDPLLVLMLLNASYLLELTCPLVFQHLIKQGNVSVRMNLLNHLKQMSTVMQT